MNVSVRNAVEPDISHFARIDAAANRQMAGLGHPEFDDGHYIPWVTAAKGIEEGRVKVAQLDDEIVGWMFLTRIGDEPCIGQLAVHPDHQQRGYGTLLVNTALNEARLAGETTIVLNTQSEIAFNQPWYERLGFVVVAQDDWTEGMSEVTRSQTDGGLDWSLRVHMRCMLEPRWTPERPIEIIAGTPQGGGQDRAARSLAAALEEVLDVGVSVSNVPGRGGGNAWDVLATHDGDGHMLSVSSATLITNRLTGVAELDHDELSHVALLCTEFIAFAVPVASELTSAFDLLEALATPIPPVVSLAVARGNVNHIALSFLCRHVGVDPSTVEVRVFDSARFAIADALERPNGVAAVSAASLLPEVGQRAVRLLATSAPQRLGVPFGDVPTWTELGVDCSIGTWRGLVGPPSLEPDRLSFWDDAVSAAVSTTAWQTSLSDHNWTDSYLPSGAVRRFMRAEELSMEDGLRSLGLLEKS